MDRISTMQTQTIQKLQNPYYAIEFIVENNPNGVVDRLKIMGFEKLFTTNLSDNKAIAKQLLSNWYNTRQTNKITEVLNNVNYLNDSMDSADYTKGFRAYAKENTPSGAVDEQLVASQLGREFSWDGLMAGLGAGLTTYTTMGNNPSGTGAAYDVANAAAEEQKKKTRTWMIIGGVVLVIVIIGVVVLMKKKKSN